MTAILLPTVMCHWQLMHQCWALLCASPSLICVQIKRGALGSRSPYRKKRCTWSWKSWNWKPNSWVAIHLTKPKWSSLLRNSLVCQDFKSSSEDLIVCWLGLELFLLLPVCTGRFQEEDDQTAARFLRVSHTMDGDMTTSESVKFDWPR